LGENPKPPGKKNPEKKKKKKKNAPTGLKSMRSWESTHYKINIIMAEGLTFVSAPPFARVARTILAVYLLSNIQWRSMLVPCQDYFHSIFFTFHVTRQTISIANFSFLIVFWREFQLLMKKKILDQSLMLDSINIKLTLISVWFALYLFLILMTIFTNVV